MNSPVAPTRSVEDLASTASRIAGVVLARVAAGAATEAVIARDVRGLLASPPPENVWRVQVSRLLIALGSAGQVTRDEYGLTLTEDGRAAVAHFLGTKGDLPRGWPALRDGPLLAKATGVAGGDASRMKALTKIDGLRLLIVERHWKLKLKGRPSASRLRQALALVALDRAFGNQVKNEVGAKSGLSPKATRLLAGQLATKPRDFKTDARLVAALAGEAVGATKSDLGALRIAVLRHFLAELPPSAPLLTAAHQTALSQADVAPKRVQARVAPPAIVVPPETAVRPNPRGFAQLVHAAAAARAEGWPGNRRASIAQVFDVIAERYAAWSLAEIEFKAMLVEAHRMGLVSLATADLKDKNRLAELERSAITYKNAIWHYVRIEE